MCDHLTWKNKLSTIFLKSCLSSSYHFRIIRKVNITRFEEAVFEKLFGSQIMSMLIFSQAFKVNKKTCDRKETFSSFPQSQINK